MGYEYLSFETLPSIQFGKLDENIDKKKVLSPQDFLDGTNDFPLKIMTLKTTIFVLYEAIFHQSLFFTL